MGSGDRLGTSSTLGAPTMGWLSIGTTRAGGAGMLSAGPADRPRIIPHPLVAAANAVHATTHSNLVTRPL